MKNKKVLIICLTIIILSSLVTSIYLITKDKEEKPTNTLDGIDLVINEDILKDATIKNLLVTDVSLFTRDGISSYKAKVTNNSNTNTTISKLYVVFHVNNEQEKILALNNIKLNAQESKFINITSETNLSNTTKIEYLLEN